MSEEEPTIEELHEQHRQLRARFLEEELKRMGAILDNSDGIQRVEAISDEEWAAALAEDEGESHAA